MDPNKKTTRWKHYCVGLLDRLVPDKSELPWIDHRAEQDIENVLTEEIISHQQ